MLELFGKWTWVQMNQSNKAAKNNSYDIWIISEAGWDFIF